MKRKKKCDLYTHNRSDWSCKNRFELKRTVEQDEYEERCDDCLKVCQNCGGVNITETVLADPNALRIIDSTGEPCFCNNCGKEVNMVSLSDYTKSNPTVKS